MHGPNVPEWNALRTELDLLVTEIGAVRAAVLDEANILWCWSSSPTGTVAEDDAEVHRLARLFHEVELSEGSLRRGRHLSILRREPDTSYVAESFAGIYVLVVWCHALFPALSAQTTVKNALAKIETLTAALPRPR